MQVQKVDRRLKEQFLNDINSQTMAAEIIRKLTVLKDMSEVTNKQV